MTDLLSFATRAEASSAAANAIAANLQRRLESDSGASLVVSGGSTPRACFRLLGQTPLDWAGVTVVMSDERWVDVSHDASNERMVRENLMQNEAASAALVSIFAPQVTAAQRCETLTNELAGKRFASALLGMGADGHFASLFPDADQLAQGLLRDSQDIYIPVTTAASPFERVSLTLAALLHSDAIQLLCFGDDKFTVIEEALSQRDAFPVSHLLHQDDVPVQIYWAP